MDPLMWRYNDSLRAISANYNSMQVKQSIVGF